MSVVQDLEVKTETQGDVLIVTISGRLDSVTTPILERKLLELIRNGNLNMILIMRKVGYISSTGLRLLGEVANKLVGLGGKLVVCSPSKNVENVFRMTSFDLLVDIVEERNKALSFFCLS